MMKKLLPVLLLFIAQFVPLPGFSVLKNYNISITVKGLENQQAILAYYADDKKYISDTIEFNADGVALIDGQRELPDGVYLIAFPTRNFEMFDLIISKENSFSLSTDTFGMIANMQVNNSLENKVLYEDLKFMVPLGKVNDSLRNILKKEEKTSELYKKADKALEEQANNIKAHRRKLVETYPNAFYASLVRVMQDPIVPKIYLNKNETWKDTTAAIEHIREHYFDIINFSDSGYIRSPVYKNFLLSYFDNYIIPVPDTLITYIDKVINKALVNGEQFQYVLSNIFNKYANSQIMGFDAIMIHMAEKYFLSGMAWWSDEDNLKKMKERVNAMKPTLIGKKAPDFVFQDTLLHSMSLYSLTPKKRFTMLIFWNSDCGHCQHEMPVLKQKYEDTLRNFDFQVIDISTEQTDSTFRKFIRKNSSKEWVTGWDPWGQSAFRHDYDVISTPKIFIIDRKNIIVGKGVGVNDLYKFLEFYSKEPEKL